MIYILLCEGFGDLGDSDNRESRDEDLSVQRSMREDLCLLVTSPDSEFFLDWIR